VAAIQGRIKAISVSQKKGTKKETVPQAHLETDFGIMGDAHAGKWHRQVSLLSFESIATMAANGTRVSPGDFAENITTEGIDLKLLKSGDVLLLGGTVRLEITQLGKECHGHCAIFDTLGDCIMPREGIFAKVTKGGVIKAGDDIEVVDD
jgi:molybdopterin adenylyltransferase